MLVSTLPYGGHYAVDLIGGAFLWAAWFALSRRLERQAITAAADTIRGTARHRSGTQTGNERIA